MYAPFFGLRQEPFSITPDPRYLYMSERHREALAHMLFGLQGGGGIVLITGEVGAGKTTVCRCFLERLPGDCNLAYIFNPKLSALELLQTICDEFGVATPRAAGQVSSVKRLLDPLNAFLLQAHAAGRLNLLVIDEAQSLSPDVLEQLRLLTNLETPSCKLLRIILLGQPELRDMLARPELAQLSQRIVARWHLSPLQAQDTGSYLVHRLAVAGLQRPLPFDRRAIRRIHRIARGNPRRINLLCDRAMLAAYARGQACIDAALVEQAAREVFAAAPRRSGHLRRHPARAALALAALAALGAGWLGVAGWNSPQEVTAGWRATRPVLPAADVPPAHRLEEALGPESEATLPVYLPAGAEGALAPSALLLRDREVAWRELARDWKAEPPPGPVCPLLARRALHCFSASLSLAQIRQIDRPGIITLDAHSDAPAYALLVALTPHSATLRAGGMEQKVDLDGLAQRWDGQFATLWRAPPGYTGGARDRLRSSAAMQWLATQLASGQPVGRADIAGSPRLFRSRLHAFQRAQGLPVTNAATPLTYMRLNRVAGVDEPSLRPQP